MTWLVDEPWIVIEVEVGPPLDIGATGSGSRRCIPLGAGTVSGAVSGNIIPGGADWQTIRDDGTLEIEAHYVFRTDAGCVVEVLSNGLRAASAVVLRRLANGEAVDPNEYYFRTAIRFRTGAADLAYLNDRMAIARGERRPHSVRLELFEIS